MFIIYYYKINNVWNKNKLSQGFPATRHIFWNKRNHQLLSRSAGLFSVRSEGLYGDESGTANLFGLEAGLQVQKKLIKQKYVQRLCQSLIKCEWHTNTLLCVRNEVSWLILGKSGTLFNVHLSRMIPTTFWKKLCQNKLCAVFLSLLCFLFFFWTWTLLLMNAYCCLFPTGSDV